jgi:hypothetical protein
MIQVDRITLGIGYGYQYRRQSTMSALEETLVLLFAKALVDEGFGA